MATLATLNRTGYGPSSPPLTPGISFICRVRDEQATLATALESLRGLTIPHEIVVILHRCTDASEDIVQACQRDQPAIRIASYHEPVSRAGVETLVTPAASRHSLPSYLSWCFGHARYTWGFRYDADFIASTQLIDYLNGEGFAAITAPTRIALPCNFDGISNTEVYLSNCLERFTKHVFWEQATFTPESTLEVHDELPIVHASSLSELKPYWSDRPWFVDHDSTEADALRRRHAYVVEALGAEPAGLARASNPECDTYFRKVLAARERLLAEDISLFD